MDAGALTGQVALVTGGGGGIASAEDMADAVLALATQLRFTTGAVIPVHGGRPLL